MNYAEKFATQDTPLVLLTAGHTGWQIILRHPHRGPGGTVTNASFVEPTIEAVLERGWKWYMKVNREHKYVNGRCSCGTDDQPESSVSRKRQRTDVESAEPGKKRRKLKRRTT